MARFTISLDDETTTKLDELADRLHQSRSTLAEIGVNLLIDTLAKADPAGLVQIGAAVGADLHTTPQVADSKPVFDPLRGAKPGDTDEILALIRAVNELPESTDLSGDMIFVNAERRATIHRQIARLRTAVEEKRAQAV